MAAFEQLLRRAMAGPPGPPHHHVSLNATKWVAMRRDAELRGVVLAASTLAPDGEAVRRAVQAPERVPGIDLAARLVRAPGARVALVGALPPIVARVRDDLAAAGVDVVFARDGWFTPADEPALAEALDRAAPSLLLLALGTPKAERFVGRFAPGWTNVRVVMGVGGAFDVWAGAATRAPAWVGRAGLEWAWRFAGDPRRRWRRAVLGPAEFVVHRALGTRLP